MRIQSCSCGLLRARKLYRLWLMVSCFDPWMPADIIAAGYARHSIRHHLLYIAAYVVP